MFRLGADLKVYLHREPIDFRAGINSLRFWSKRRCNPFKLVGDERNLDPANPLGRHPRQDGERP
ncbi:hypothetical protein ACVDG8_026810 [Mesorhizobium sp. ORM8.1]